MKCPSCAGSGDRFRVLIEGREQLQAYSEIPKEDRKNIQGEIQCGLCDGRGIVE